MISALLNTIDKICQPKVTESESSQSAVLSALSLLYLLADADHQFETREEKKIEEISQQLYGLDQAAVHAVLAQARRSASDSTSLYEFTRHINDTFSEEQKLQLVEVMWDVAHADDELSKFEEHFIRRVCDLIYVHHAGFIQMKLKSQEKRPI